VSVKRALSPPARPVQRFFQGAAGVFPRGVGPVQERWRPWLFPRRQHFNLRCARLNAVLFAGPRLCLALSFDCSGAASRRTPPRTGSVPYVALNFGLYEYLNVRLKTMDAITVTTWLLRSATTRATNSMAPRAQSTSYGATGASLVAGGVSGSVAMTLTYPMELVRRRMVRAAGCWAVRSVPLLFPLRPWAQQHTGARFVNAVSPCAAATRAAALCAPSDSRACARRWCRAWTACRGCTTTRGRP
jgi:hypothetical protein